MTGASAFTTNQPYSGVSNFASEPVFIANAVSANFGTSSPFLAVSLPPVFLVVSSCEYFFARAANFAPFFSWL